MISSNQAVTNAMAEAPPQGDDLTVSTTYAVFDDEDATNKADLAPPGGVDVWLVTFIGGCIWTEPDPCVPATWNVLINAGDGSTSKRRTPSVPWNLLRPTR